MPRSTAAPSQDILEAALQGLETQREKLDEHIAQVRAMMKGRPGRPPKAATTTAAVAERKPASRKTTRKKRVLTPEARKRIAAAQKKRWAAFRKDQS